MSEKPPLIILAGPTAVGKTKTSIELAKAIHGEIISADSMQVYKHMNIGTAKISEEEMDGVKHFLIDVFDPDEEFSVAVFQEETKKAIAEIYKKGKIPILVGGTGFYIQAILYDIEFSRVEGREYRQELEDFVLEHGAQALHDRLMELDPKSAETIHPNNIQRVVRAVEYCLETGKKFSEHNAIQKERTSIYNHCYFVLNDDRELLYERINERIDIMIKDGLVKEVESLLDMGYTKDLVSMQGLGYKEIIAYLEGEISLEEAIYILKRDTRHFAKRQLTWFRREEDVIWVNKNQFAYNQDEILEFMLNKMKVEDIIL